VVVVVVVVTADVGEICATWRRHPLAADDAIFSGSDSRIGFPSYVRLPPAPAARRPPTRRRRRRRKKKMK